jgi:RimJ/RimL family protein N-acetyltransferase
MRPLEIRTERLTISPFTEADAARLAEIAGVPDVARMMSSFPLPYSEELALERIRTTTFKGTLGFLAGIRREGELIGLVGIGGDPVDAAYLIGADHWGQGYATEAMSGFLTEIFARFDLDEVEAGAFTDNPASHRVLEKLGFERIDEVMETSKARLEPAPLFKYRLTRDAFANRKLLT